LWWHATYPRECHHDGQFLSFSLPVVYHRVSLQKMVFSASADKSSSPRVSLGGNSFLQVNNQADTLPEASTHGHLDGCILVHALSMATHVTFSNDVKDKNHLVHLNVLVFEQE
jgi:hypothetical protein